MCYWKKIHDWLYYRHRGSSSGTGTRATLKLASTRRLLLPWQAFQKLFSDELKAGMETEWQEHRKENPDSPKTLFQFRNERAQARYEESDEEVKKQVEEYRQQCKDGSVEGRGEQNSEFQM